MQVIERRVAEGGEHGPLVFLGRPDVPGGELGTVIGDITGENGQITLHGASPV